MPAVLDYSILSSLSIIFVFLAIFLGGWGLLVMVNPFKFDKDQKRIYAVLAFALAFIVLMSPNVLAMFRFAIPWFSILLLIGFFMLFFAKVFSDKVDGDSIIKQPVVYGFLIFFISIIMIFAFANSFGQDLLEEQPGVVNDADRINGDYRPVDSFVPVDEMDDYEYYPNGTTAIPVTATNQDDIGSNIVLTIFHPKILGMLFMLVLATVTILLIAK